MLLVTVGAGLSGNLVTGKGKLHQVKEQLEQPKILDAASSFNKF